jgi:outer membrane protein assembly factor BamD
MFVKKTKLQFLLIFFFVLSCSSSDDKKLADFSKKNKIELSALWRFAIDDLNNSLPEEAIEKFKLVEKDYSYTEWAPRSLLMVAYTYYEANRCIDAISTLERYIKFYPNNLERIYAEYLKGVCYFEDVSEFSKDQANTIKAINQFKLLIDSYPNTEYANDAKYKLDLLNDLLAGKEMYVARYYMNQQKWSGAINRLKTIVEKYQTTIYIEEALYRLVEIYHKLGLEEDASKTAAILGYNFNSSEWYKKSYLLVLTNQTTLPKKDKSLLDGFKKILN